MTRALIWRPEARQSMHDITTYIAERRPAAAQHLADAILHAANRLADHPHIHRPGRVPGTREAVIHPNYVLVYRVRAETIEILSLLHARQLYP